MITPAKKVIISIAIIICAPLWVPIILMLCGYYVNMPGWKVAQILVDKEQDVQKCHNIIYMPWKIYSPPNSEQRWLCVHEYASLTKDPSACELLMPSDYGWDCLGAAEEPNARMCWFDFGKNAQKIGDKIMPECGSGVDSMAGRCCEMAKNLYVQKITTCDEFKDTEILHDQCQELLAKRDRNIDLCIGIQSPHVRTACEVAVRALEKS